LGGRDGKNRTAHSREPVQKVTVFFYSPVKAVFGNNSLFVLGRIVGRLNRCLLMFRLVGFRRMGGTFSPRATSGRFVRLCLSYLTQQAQCTELSMKTHGITQGFPPQTFSYVAPSDTCLNWLVSFLMPTTYHRGRYNHTAITHVSKRILRRKLGLHQEGFMTAEDLKHARIPTAVA